MPADVLINQDTLTLVGSTVVAESPTIQLWHHESGSLKYGLVARGGSAALEATGNHVRVHQDGIIDAGAQQIVLGARSIQLSQADGNRMTLDQAGLMAAVSAFRVGQGASQIDLLATIRDLQATVRELQRRVATLEKPR